MKSTAWAIIMAVLVWDSTYRKVHLGDKPTEQEALLRMVVIGGFLLSLIIS